MGRWKGRRSNSAPNRPPSCRRHHTEEQVGDWAAMSWNRLDRPATYKTKTPIKWNRNKPGPHATSMPPSAPMIKLFLLHIVSKLRTSGTVPPFPLHASMAWTWKLYPSPCSFQIRLDKNEDNWSCEQVERLWSLIFAMLRMPVYTAMRNVLSCR